MHLQGGLHYYLSLGRFREAAYAALSPVQRPLYHRQVAHALAEIHAEAIEPISAQLAVHYEVAGALEQAINYYQHAADMAHMLFADDNAVVFLHRALTLLASLPVTFANQERELALLLQLNQPLAVAQGFLAPELEEISTRASFLAQQLEKEWEFFNAISNLRSFYQMRGHYQKAETLAEQMISLLQERSSHHQMIPSSTEEKRNAVSAHHGLATLHFLQGELTKARTHWDQAIAIQQPTTPLYAFSALDFWLLGYPDTARQQMYQSLAIAQTRGHPHHIGFAMTNLARLNHFLRRTDLVKLWAEKAIEQCAPYDIPFWTNLGKLFLGRAWAERDEPRRGIAQLNTTLNLLQNEDHQAFCSHFWSLLAEAHANAGQFAQALDTLAQAMKYVERNGEGFWHSELVRLRGDYRLAQGAQFGEVEELYQQSIAIAQRQRAKSLELRATISLARIWHRQGRSTEAFRLLTDIYRWFREGFNTPDLQEARALLNALT